MLGERVESLERELETANHEIAQLKEGHQFFQRLLEDPAARQAAAAKLPKPDR
jgi:prefoldin subunit 5